MMKIRFQMLNIFLIVAVLNLVPNICRATVSYAEAFVNKYPTTPYALKNCNRCELCHTDRNNAGSNNVGSYGNAWFSAWGRLQTVSANQAVNDNAMKAFSDIESQDADADGTSNIMEINGGMNPNDPNRDPAVNSCSSGNSSFGQNTTFSSTDLTGDFNPNALNSSCGLVKNQGSQFSNHQDPTRILISMFLFLLPLLFVAYLKSNNEGFLTC